MIYKVKYNKLSNKWMVLKKEMLFIGRLDWFLVEEFITKKDAVNLINELTH